MKNVWLILFIITFTCCNSRHKTTDNNKTSNVDKVLNEDKTLSSDDIMLDSTNIYVFKNSQEKVTGILKTQIQEFFHDDEIIRETIIRNGVAYNVIDYSKEHVLIGECDLKHGKLEGEYRMYYPSRKIKAKFYLKDDKLNGLFQSYDKYNGLETEMNYKDGVLDGVAKYYSNGKQTKEILYENGKEVKSYKFDVNGNKIVPIIECLELIQYKTGYYEYVDNRHNQILYQPMIILKFKNITDKPLKEEITITGIFTSNDEEWSNESYYFQRTWETPLQPNISRQLSVKSDVGWKNPAGVGQANIKCKILINGNVYKTIKIANKFLYSNRL
ncbi:toxin-antitoxin system YwqK family antitoxin [Butyricimonas sp. Marseille-P3923]|uniref:toxin-antitoxin system YwqK family antitoxin n=1 Tax=Butyricimonas sp. Marseille-P3923 TaxID=1987504 RepID=UPI000C07A820|nr:hypothetical protein [Butyricimonas sp. Marseille-P3923]